MDHLNKAPAGGEQRSGEASAGTIATVSVKLGVEADEERVRNWAHQHGQKAAQKQIPEKDPAAAAARLWSERKPFAYASDQEEGFQRIFRTGFEEGWQTVSCFTAPEYTAADTATTPAVQNSVAPAIEETSPTPTAGTSPAPVTQAAQPPRPVRVVDERDEPYIFDECTVTITLQMLPLAQGETSREVIIGVSSHLDAPLMDFTRLEKISPLPEPITRLLVGLAARMPEMQRFHEEERAKAKAATPKRAVSTQSKKGTSVTGHNSQPGSQPGLATTTGPMPTEQNSLFNLAPEGAK